MVAYLPRSKLLSEAVLHNDKALILGMAQRAEGAPTVAWRVVPLESMGEDAPVGVEDADEIAYAVANGC